MPCWVQAHWCANCFRHVGGCPLSVHCGKGSWWIFHQPGTNGSASTAFNPLAAQKRAMSTRVLFLYLSGGEVGATQAPMTYVYQQCWKEWAGGCVP